MQHLKYFSTICLTFQLFILPLHHNENNKTMVKTTSLKHYKKLKAMGVTVQLVTKQEINKR